MTDKDAIREQFSTHQIRRVKIGGFDVDGVLRGKYVSPEKFWSIVDGGMGFCDVIFGWDSSDVCYEDAKFTGWHTGYPDTPAKIDLDTFRVIPWEPGTAAFILDFEAQDGTPTAVSPRQLLRSVLKRADDMGFAVTAAMEFEFFIYQEEPEELRERGFFRPRPLSPGMFGYSWLRTSQSSGLVHDLLDACDEFGLPIEGFHTETGPGVFEAALRYTDALEAADRAALFKTVVKEICSHRDLMATFMAKPANGLPGCSGHTHQSLQHKDSGASAFYEPNADRGMSEVCRQYLAGQLALLPDIAALLAPNINSYKRLLDGNWAPNAATWGVENRTCAIRYIPGSDKSTRLEHRFPAADTNPHTALAAMIATGLYGIENKLEPQDAVTGNGYTADAPKIPMSLHAATDALENSATVKQILSPDFIDHYVMSRRWEVLQSEKAVTDWELRRYFELA